MTHIEKSNLQRLDNNDLDIKPTEIIAFCCVRNELIRLPYLLEYHRRLGVDRFFVIDNASSDDTIDYLLTQHDVHLFYTEDSYAESMCGIHWLNQLICEFGTEHWILTLDADEMFIYPNCENVNLHQLVDYLNMEGVQAIQTFLIDMYSNKPIKETHYNSTQPFLDVCSFFDTNSYHDFNKDNIPTRGGPRYRLFWKDYDREKLSPYLINVPLIKWRKDLKYEVGTHIISNLKIAELSGAKLHFKFFSDFYTCAETESSRNEHWDNAAQYKSYWDVLSKKNNLSAMYEGSIKYKDSIQLIELGLMIQPNSYIDFIKRNNYILTKILKSLFN